MERPFPGARSACGQHPRGPDPQLPFIAIVWWTNRELLHHMAEIGVLRGLWSARVARE